jgi:DNA-binding transcriptional LysR family regulator
MLNLRRLRYFLFVGRELHYGRAADLLGISQPAISQQIAILEEELGVTLLMRDRRHVELTPAGEVLIEYASKIVDLSEMATAAVRRAKAGKHSNLRVAYTTSALLPVSELIIKAFQTQHAEVNLELQSGSTSRNLEDLLHGRVDVAFVRPLFKDPQIRGIEICREDLAVAVPTHHELANAAEIRVKDLQTYPVILRPGQYELFRHELWTEGPPMPAGEEPDEQHALLAVARGQGIFVLPEAWGRTLHVDGVVVKSFERPRPSVALLVAFNDEYATQNARKFIDVARTMKAAGAPIP